MVIFAHTRTKTKNFKAFYTGYPLLSTAFCFMIEASHGDVWLSVTTSLFTQKHCVGHYTLFKYHRRTDVEAVMDISQLSAKIRITLYHTQTVKVLTLGHTHTKTCFISFVKILKGFWLVKILSNVLSLSLHLTTICLPCEYYGFMRSQVL